MPSKAEFTPSNYLDAIKNISAPGQDLNPPVMPERMRPFDLQQALEMCTRDSAENAYIAFGDVTVEGKLIPGSKSNAEHISQFLNELGKSPDLIERSGAKIASLPEKYAGTPPREIEYKFLLKNKAVVTLSIQGTQAGDHADINSLRRVVLYVNGNESEQARRTNSLYNKDNFGDLFPYGVKL